jgi:cobalt/nickel transport system permease protein
MNCHAGLLGPPSFFPVPLAVHISDGVLAPAWLAGGFILAGVLAFLGSWRIRDEEIPKVALMTAAFFVASLLHVRIFSTSVHLLLTGLVGVILGWRAALAIPVGLFLQAALLNHGGFTTLGVNSCVMVLPALLSWQLFAGLRRVPWVRRPWFRSLLVAISTMAWILSLVFSLSMLFTNPLVHRTRLDTEWADFVTFHPLTLTAALVLAGLAAWGERWFENAPEFPVGLLVGEIAVLATIFLNCFVLIGGGEEQWDTLALVLFIAHLPIAVVEGVVLGFTVGFLVRVKPEMLAWEEPIVKPTPASTPALANGTVSGTSPATAVASIARDPVSEPEVLT